jgi:hypothetical protein
LYKYTWFSLAVVEKSVPVIISYVKGFPFKSCVILFTDVTVGYVPDFAVIGIVLSISTALTVILTDVVARTGHYGKTNLT